MGQYCLLIAFIVLQICLYMFLITVRSFPVLIYYFIQVHPYLATDCSYSSSTDNNPTSNGEEEVGGHDNEKQHIQTMKLSEVKEALLNGKFVEVQWSNTVALAILHLS